MQIKYIFVLVIFHLSLNAWAKCEAVAWPFSDKASDLSVEKLNGVERDHLYAYLYHEISVDLSKRKPGLAKKLFHYLGNTELNEGRMNLVKALEWAADLDNPKTTVISLDEICSLEAKVMREPASSKKKK